jgi:starch synthase
MALHVLSVTSEAVPLIKTGGLADVAGALPSAVAAHGIAMTTLLPGYPQVLASLQRKRAVHAWDSLLGRKARLLKGTLSGQPLLVLDAPDLFVRGGNPYLGPDGRDWPDNWLRFGALARAAADLAGGAVPGLRFDLLHAHDWQAALAPAYLRFAPHLGSGLPSVVTIHNLAFQGWFPRETLAPLGLPEHAWTLDGVEAFGGVGFLKAGIASASALTTVSPTYAREIATSGFGMGLEGLIRDRAGALTGILNGIDTEVWNPMADAELARRFSARTLGQRSANTRALEREFGLAESDGPLFIVVSRLTQQKGMDVLLECIDHLVGIGGRLAVLGSGDASMEQALREAGDRHPGKVGVRIGYDEALSHRMQGGGDAILIPSRFEPCGLTQLYGLAYGCVPVVARTGGLADTVIDANPAALSAGVATGIQHGAVSYESLCAAIDRAVALFNDGTAWAQMRRNGMKADFSWGASGRAYADLYKSLVA